MKLIIVSISMLLLNISHIFSQSNGFGFKSGPTAGFQNWNGSQRDPLFAWHAAAFADSESSDGNIIYGQLGYHVKGGALRYNRFIDQFGNIYPGQTFAMKFNNLGAEVGFKRFLKVKKIQPYYALGLRAEYTLSTKFEINEALREWVRKWNYGFSAHAGINFPVKKLMHMGLDLHIGPDLSKQIFVPAGVRYYDPNTGTVSPGYEQSIKNLVIEISLYVRFIQLIIYEDQ